MTRPKLLLADDSVTIRKVVELTFADEGIDVSTVADANAAMQKFVEIQPDIVLVYVGLAETNGYQICEMIKADEATNHIPVLLLVGSFEPFDEAEAERVGADGFLTKPFHSIRDLVARVWDLLGRETAASNPPDEPESVNETPVVTPETADIVSLYQSSFAETMKLDELDTVEDLLGDAGMDDEMIEASYPSIPLVDDSDIILPLPGEEPEATKEFDWSIESIITESRPEEAEKPSFEPKFVFDDSDPQNNEDRPTTPDFSEELVLDPETTYGESDLATPDVITHLHPPSGSLGELEAQPKIDDVEIESLTSHGVPEDQPDTTANEPAEFYLSDSIDPAIHETIPDDPRSIDGLWNGSTNESPSPELIEMIARSVVERLSDTVIREIAQVEVPRIAEKLIREALEEESRG